MVPSRMGGIMRSRVTLAASAFVLAAALVLGTWTWVNATTRPILTSGAQISTNAWYSNNYSVAGWSKATVSDGTNIWVASSDRNNVTKLNGTTGATIGTYTVGTGPEAIAFDGTNIWVANYTSNNVTKLNGTTGATIGTYTVGTRPRAIVFDGGSIWVANSGSNNITKLNITTGAASGTFAVGSGPAAMTMCASTLWVANESASSISKINTTSGSTIGTYSGIVSTPNAIACDGRNLWVTSINSSSVVKINNFGTVLGTYPLTATASSIAFDQPGYSTSTSPNWDSNTYMWATHYFDNVVSKIRISDGVVVSVLPTASGPRSVAFDGTNIWIGSTGVVTKIGAR